MAQRLEERRGVRRGPPAGENPLGEAVRAGRAPRRGGASQNGPCAGRGSRRSSLLHGRAAQHGARQRETCRGCRHDTQRQRQGRPAGRAARRSARLLWLGMWLVRVPRVREFCSGRVARGRGRRRGRGRGGTGGRKSAPGNEGSRP